ncbi:MAG: efflux RND transporter permease subunit [Chloroflexota bacterium]
MTVTEIAIKRPTLVVVFFSFLGVLGIFGFNQLKYDLMPKMDIPIIIINTIYPGGSPADVETSVTRVIEDAVTGIDKVDNVTATSYEGRSMVRIELQQNANIDLALQDAQRKVNAAQFMLPTTALTPVVSKIAFDEIPVLRMSLKSIMPAREFYQLVEDEIQPRISKIGGVGQVLLIGGEKREIRVNIDADRASSYGLSLASITNAIKMANSNFPTGQIRGDNSQLTVRVAGRFANIGEMRDFIVARSKDGSDVRLGDVAEVEDAVIENSTINRLNGDPSIGLVVQKQSDANTVDVSRGVRKELALMEQDFSNIGLKFAIAQDASTFTLESAHAVEEDLLIAILLVALVMLIFLHSIRNSLIVMVAIPASLISTFFMMYAFDFTLNMMTLLAMSLVIGILVDDSIVVLENIYRFLESGENKRSAALKGRNEIGFAALSITLVDVVVFVPLALVVGRIGSMLREYALVVVFSTLMSLVVSFTITPALASRFSKLESFKAGSIMGAFGAWFERQFRRLQELYKEILQWSLRHGFVIIAMSVVLFIASIFLFPLGFIGSEFIPQVDRGELIITVETEPGSTLENTNRLALQIEKMVGAMPEVDRILSNVGTSSEGLVSSGGSVNNSMELNVALVPRDQRELKTDEVSQKIRAMLRKIPGSRSRVTPVGLMGTSGRAPIQISVTGNTHKDVREAAKTIMEVARRAEGATDVRLSSEEGKPELRVEVDRAKLAQFGLSIAEVGQNLRIAFTGDNDAKFEENDNEYDIRVVLDRFDRTNIDQVGNLAFTNMRGEVVRLKQFASFYQATGPTKLERENRAPALTVNAMVFGKTSGAVAGQIRENLAGVKLPTGVRWEFTGEQKNMAESFSSMGWALLAGILFVYMIMVALYNSYLYPFVVLFSIPVAMIGAFLALALTMKSMSIYSILGVIMLIGLVAKNAILLVDRANQTRAERSLSVVEALIEAGEARLRPILMTTMAMVIGMLPIALSTGAGGEAKSGLGMALIGGLTSSLLLTLVLVPVIYLKFESAHSRLLAWRTRRKTRLEAAPENL